MVELQLPKLITWVRFPSPAPNHFLYQGYGKYLTDYPLLREIEPVINKRGLMID